METIGALRTDLSLIMLAAVCLAAGVVSIILWTLRSRDPLLLWLGIFASLYGIRLFLTSHLIVVAAGADARVSNPAVAIITYCIPIPLVLFLRELIGSGWKNAMTIWLRTQIVFAFLAIVAGVFGSYQNVTDKVNNVLVIAGSLISLVRLFSNRSTEAGAKIVKVGFTICFAFVVMNNLNLNPFGPALEPIGFLGLVFVLGYAAALRTITREHKLVEVEQELATARRIQSSILPKSLPDMVGLDIATRYLPMTAVAGDFYDFLLIDEHRMTILVADVSGHGVPAALIASMLKVGIVAQRHHAVDPAAILGGLNGMLRGVLDGQFVTAACVFIDLDAHILTYSGAGHPPALLARFGAKDIIELAENGLFLGPFPNAAYSNLTVPFERGDKLLLYTDGIIEATQTDGEPFGDQGLKEFMMQHHAAGVSAFADDLIRAASGPMQEDDLTLVVAQAR